MGSGDACAQEIDTPSHRLAPNAVDSGGGGAATTSHQLNMSAGEAGGAKTSFTSSALYPGLMNVASFPGTTIDLSSVAQSSTAVQLNFSAPGYDGGLGSLQAGSSYSIQWATETAVIWSFSSAQVVIATSAVSPASAQSALVSGLLPNTTTYFRLWTLDAAGDLSALSNGTTVATLARVPQASASPFVLVGVSSVSAGWGAFAPSPSSMTAEGYLLQASTAADFSGTILSSSTASPAASTLTVTGLFSNTTYYFRVGALNWSGAANYAALGSTLTLISPDVTPPSPVVDLAASAPAASALSLNWTAPSDPDNIPLNGTYAIQYATWTGVTWATSSAQVLISTLNVTAGAAQGSVAAGLSPNTTYFFRLWTADGKPNWSSLSNGTTVATLAAPPAGAQIVTLSTNAATVSWTALPVSPASATAEGYRLEASSTNFGALSPGGLVYSSATAGALASTLTISGLDPNTTYYYRAASLNWAQAPNYATVGAAATLADPAAALNPAFLDVFTSSATGRWAALPVSPSSATSEGYRLELSSTNFGALSPGGLVYSSATTAAAAGALTVSGLDPNTTYYSRVASLNWDAAADYTTLSATSTLANAPILPGPMQVFVSSAVLSWA
ncbi:MAG: fibronectin type III domain-containing protein, partial [Elusimicrobia bacterium]|nr:fibronectin type III domain-containing protein [Elusimicrobiota bacterium]